MKLGKLPPVHDSRTLQLANYLSAALVPPPRIDWAAKLTNIGMMKNDELGDCTCAGAGHLIQTWTANNGSQVIIPDDAVVKAYEAVSGYVPGDPSTDNGAVKLNVLNYWRKTGIGGHKIFAFVSQEPKNRQHVELSVDLLGGCSLGIALPISAQRQRVWSVPPGGPVGDGAPGSWGGHDVPIVAYGPTGPICITWGELKTMTWKFFETYCLSPETKILTRDLRWKPAGDLAQGEKLVGFDENGPHRHWREAAVTGIESIVRPCYDVFFEDGTKVRCSREHLWLCRNHHGQHWMRTDELRFRGSLHSRVVKPVDVWTENRSWEAGYVAAGLDGEGHLTCEDLRTRTKGVAATRLGFSQKNTSAMLPKFIEALNTLGIEHSIGKLRRDGMLVVSINKRHGIMRALGMTRPARLLPKFVVDGSMEGRHRAVRVMHREPVGDQPVVSISTDTRTFIAEGFASHNCDEAYGILSSDWATGTKIAPSGFDFSQLQKDLALIAH